MDLNNLQASRIEGQIADLNWGTADYRMLYVISGELNIIFDGQSYCAVPGQVVIETLTNRDVAFSSSADFAGYLLLINDPVAGNLMRRHLPYVKVAGSLAIVLAAEKKDQSIRMFFENIVKDLQSNSDSATTAIETHMQELFACLYRTSSQILSGMYSNREEIVLGVRDLLEKKYYAELSLEAVAAEYNISVSYLAHIFKEITGMSVMRCLLLIRVREAQKYLKQTNLQIREIAEKCGFNDVSNFGRTFRKETGCAPRQYRRAHFALNKEENSQ